VYPAIAAAYALLFGRAYLKKVLPMFLVSAMFVLVHFRFAPPPHDGVYAPNFGGQVFLTFWTYWKWALGPSRPAVALLTCAVPGLLVWSVRAGQRVPLFGVAWFVIVTGPYLPLSGHKMDYYLTVPVAGLALMGASAMAYAWRSKWIWKAATAACVAVYLGTSLPAAWTITRWHHDRSVRVEDLVLGVADIHAAQPGKIILLDGLDSDLFWSGIVDAPFRAMEIPHVYLAPGSEARLQAPADLEVKYILPQALALRALQEGRALVYRVDGPALRNVTARYRAMAEGLWKPETPRFINLGDSAFAEYAGSSWDDCAESYLGYRMLRQAATVRIGGPRRPDDRLYIGVFRVTAFHLGARVDGADLPVEILSRSSELTELGVRLPAELTGKADIEVTLLNGNPEPLKFGFVEIR